MQPGVTLPEHQPRCQWREQCSSTDQRVALALGAGGGISGVNDVSDAQAVARATALAGSEASATRAMQQSVTQPQ
eukprot:1700659-Rhodomonas_salina.1